MMISECKKIPAAENSTLCKGLPIIILLKQIFFFPFRLGIFPLHTLMEDGRHLFQDQRSLFFLQKLFLSKPKDIIMLYLGLLLLPSCVDNSKRYFSLTYSATRGDEYLTERQESYFIALLRGRKTKNLLYTHPAVATEADTEYTIAPKTLRQHF